MEDKDGPILAALSEVEERHVFVENVSPTSPRLDGDLEPADDSCVVCFERTPGAALACGHQHFCDVCSAKFMSCPLCRQPCATLATAAAAAGDDRTQHGRRSARGEPNANPGEPRPQGVLTGAEKKVLGVVCFSVWLFLFIGGFIEWCFHVPGRSAEGSPGSGEGAALEACEDGGCQSCSAGWFQGGRGCFAYLEDLPPVQVGAALGGSFYFVLIVVTQLSGIACEVGLIHRVFAILPSRERRILFSALAIEIVRMLVIDLFVLQQYFASGSYKVFRAPIDGACKNAYDQVLAATNLGSNETATALEWIGADGETYCSLPQAPAIIYTTTATDGSYSGGAVSVLDPSELRPASTAYYIANSREDYTSDSSQCSLFTKQDALLDYDETSGTWGRGGHPRFSRVGWVIGGEFALYYFFATFINELADCMFVVPTTTPAGWRCKIFSIALEVAQLGALAPAAVFDHNPCLSYKAPLHVSIGVIRDLIVPWGYCIWSLLVACIPLAVCGAIILGTPFLLGKAIGACSACCARVGERTGACDSCARRRRPGGRLDSFAAKMAACTAAVEDGFAKVTRGGLKSVMLLSFIPMLLTGCFLGLLVIVGQGSKQGGMQVLTALVLLTDVLFKVGATLLTEAHEYWMHRRVTRVLAARRGNSKALGYEEAEEAA